MHGAVVIEKALLPIGLLSEEAAECRNKHLRQYRQNFARKFSREECNLDVINRLLLTSDPLISSMRPTPKKQTCPFSPEAKQMLLPAKPQNEEEEIEDETESEEEEEMETEDM